MDETSARQTASTVATIGLAPPSAAGPAAQGESQRLLPPALQLPRPLVRARFSVRQIELMFRARRELGEVFRLPTTREDVVVTSHPDHVRSLFTADQESVPSLTGESPLRPIVGPSSVLTTIGAQHMRQRKLLLPPFHGEAVARYADMISEIVEREIDRWQVSEPFALAPRMQSITLDVIMAAVFGIATRPPRGTLEQRLRVLVRRGVAITTRPLAQLGELLATNNEQQPAVLRPFFRYADRLLRELIAKRRAESQQQGSDVLSLLLAAHDEHGVPLTDDEIRDQLVSLVLAGHETTANSLAWGFERLLRTPAAYDRLRESVRSDADDGYLDATIYETMRSRPVVPIIGRRVRVPWTLGDYVVPAGTPVTASIVLLHHRHDVYPEPFAFRPERFLGQSPGTYTWIPFGGGIRRCLGASLAIAEQRAVLAAIARRTDLRAPDPAPEHVRHRNVTMIPAHGTQVVLVSRRPAG